MNILMVHPHDIYSDLEPWTVRITYLARELCNEGHHVTLAYHPLASGQPVYSNSLQTYEFKTVPMERGEFRLLVNCMKMKELANWADIVHFQKCSHYASIPAIFSAYFHRIPIHYDWDDWEQKIYEQDNSSRVGSWIYFQQMERHIPSLVDTISVSSRHLQMLAQEYGIHRDRIFYIPVGADPDVFSPDVDGSEIISEHEVKRYIVLYHGQISGANYIHLYLLAVKHILDRRDDVTFFVVGGGDRLEIAKKLAQQLNIDDCVIFTGAVPHKKVAAYVAIADVVVACFEDNEQARCKSPLKLVEYMACGKAIVASGVGEVPGMLCDAGLIVNDTNPSAMADAIHLLLEDGELRKQLGGKARKRSEDYYNWKRGMETLLEAYHKAFTWRYSLDS